MGSTQTTQRLRLPVDAPDVNPSDPTPITSNARMQPPKQPAPPRATEHGKAFGQVFVGRKGALPKASQQAKAQPILSRAHPPQSPPTNDAKPKGDVVEARADHLPRDEEDEEGLLHASTRHAAHLAPPFSLGDGQPNGVNGVNAIAAPAAAREVDAAPTTAARVSMEELLPQLVRRIAWAADRKRGTVQLELGAGRHEGTTVTVHADGGRVRIELGGKDADGVADLRSRIDARLRRQGIDVESVT